MHESSDNEQTLRTYKKKLQKYIDSTPKQISEAESVWIKQALDLIPKPGKILEIGSGAGRNAIDIQKRGYDITCTDALQEFVDLLRRNGLEASLLDALKDNFGHDYDMIFANGVLVHFTPDETENVLKKVYASLKNDGIFAFSVKQGEGSEWTSEKLGEPRFFHYWQPEPLKQLVEFQGFEWLAMLEGKTSLQNTSWLYIIARKAIK